MAVASTFEPPAQPTTGALTYVPLGGDGYSAPLAAYSIQNHAVTGDATGGAASLTVDMDPRFCSLVSFVSFSILQATSADAEYSLKIGSSTGTQIPSILHSDLQVAVSSTVSSKEINKTFNLIPMMMPGAGQAGQINLLVKNVDTDIVRLSALIYLFNIRVRELTAMGPLLWSRGAT